MLKAALGDGCVALQIFDQRLAQGSGRLETHKARGLAVSNLPETHDHGTLGSTSCPQSVAPFGCQQQTVAQLQGDRPETMKRQCVLLHNTWVWSAAKDILGSVKIRWCTPGIPL